MAGQLIAIPLPEFQEAATKWRKELLYQPISARSSSISLSSAVTTPCST